MEKSKSKVKIIWDKTKTILFFAVCGLLLSYIAVEAFLPNQTVKVFGFKPYVVITRSMEPILSVNDLVVVKNFDAEDLEVDDIITFMADINYDGTKEVVTHYIYSITENIQGDLIFRTRRYYEDPSDYTADTWFLTESDILGQYMFQIPRIGVLILFFQSPFGIAALVVNVGVIIAVVKILKTPEKKEPIKEIDSN